MHTRVCIWTFMWNKQVARKITRFDTFCKAAWESEAVCVCMRAHWLKTEDPCSLCLKMAYISEMVWLKMTCKMPAWSTARNAVAVCSSLAEQNHLYHRCEFNLHANIVYILRNLQETRNASPKFRPRYIEVFSKFSVVECDLLQCLMLP